MEKFNIEKEREINKFIYRDNSTNEHNVVFECEAKNILEADELYKTATGNDSAKQMYIGCSINEAKRIPEEKIKILPPENKKPNYSKSEIVKEFENSENERWQRTEKKREEIKEIDLRIEELRPRSGKPRLSIPKKDNSKTLKRFEKEEEEIETLKVRKAELKKYLQEQ